MISSESKETPASHSNSPHSSTPPVPLSWNEATDALRLPLGLIPTFIPNPGSTNAPGTTAYMLCRPPYSEPECSANDEGKSFKLCFLFIRVISILSIIVIVFIVIDCVFDQYLI